MATVLINTASCNSDYIVNLPNTYSLGTYLTIQDNGLNPSYFTSNSIVIKIITSGYSFYDGSRAHYIRRSGDYLTLVAMTSAWRVVNTAAYATSGDAFLTAASTTHMVVYGGLSLSNLTTNSLTTTGGIDLQNPPTLQGDPLATTLDIVSTVDGLGSIGYLSSVSFMNSVLRSTVAGLGSYGYISTPHLVSTVAGLGSSPGNYISSPQLTSTLQGLGAYYLSTPALTSTVGGLGTYGYISASWLNSTVAGLGSSGYISTSQLFSTVNTVFSLTSSNTTSTFVNLGSYYISSASLVSTVQGLSNLYVTPIQLASSKTGLSVFSEPNVISTIIGLGNLGYISSLSLYSTVGSIVASNQSAVARALSSLGSSPGYISSASLQSTVAGLATYGYISLSQLVSTTSTVSALNRCNLVSTVANLGTFYVSSSGLVSTTTGLSLFAQTILTSTIDGLGSPPFSLVSSASLHSTVAGLGVFLSLAQLITTTSNVVSGQSNTITSTIAGLGSAGYISTNQLTSTVTGLTAAHRSNLISTVNTLGSSSPGYISSASLQSTVAGLGSIGHVSLSQLISTTSNLAATVNTGITSTIEGLGSAGYISTTQLTSTVTGLSLTQQSNLISTVNTLGSSPPAYISSVGLHSTVAGLGSLGYVSLSQLISTTSNITAGANTLIISTIDGLGSAGYISATQLNSTVAGFTATNQLNLISTVNTLGSSAPAYISSTGLQSTVAGLGSLGHVSLSQLTSTTSGITLTVTNATASTANGLGSMGYISTQQIVSTVAGFSNTTRVSLVSTVNTLDYVTTAQLTSTQTALGTTVTQNDVVAANSILTYTTFPNQYTIALDTLGSPPGNYISTAQVVSTVTGINGITTSNMTSTTNTLGSSVPRYISTAHLVSTTAGILGLGYMALSNVISTTSNFQSGSYGTTSTLDGLGSSPGKYISTSQLYSTVTGFSNTTQSNLISTVNTLGSSAPGYISSASLQSTVAGLGTAGYISLIQLTSTTTGLPPPTTLPTSMVNSVNTLAGTFPLVSTPYQGTGYYTSITYTPSLILYADYNIYTNNYAGTAHTILYTRGAYIYGLAYDGTNVYAATSTQLFSVSLATGVSTPIASSYTFSSLRGISLDSTNSNLYVCDNGTGNLLQINLTTQTPSILIYIPGILYIVIDPSNTYAYITINNNSIYKIRLSDATYTQVSTFTQAYGISLDSTKQIAYVACPNINTIYQIDLVTGAPTLIAGNGSRALQDGPLLNASFNESFGLIFNIYDSSIYVADSGNNAIRRITLKTFSYISSLSLQSSVAGLGLAPFSYISTASLVSTVANLGTFGYLSTGYLISTTAGSSNVSMAPFTSTNAGLGSAGYISTSALSNIVPDVYSVTTYMNSYVYFPYSIAFSSNYIFYSGGYAPTFYIYRNTFDGKNQSIFYISNLPVTSLACDLSNVYAVIDIGHQIFSISMSTSSTTILANTNNTIGFQDGTVASAIQFNYISGLCVDSTNRYLYIADRNNNKLRRLQFSNGKNLFNVSSFVLPNDFYPISVAVDSLNQYAYLGGYYGNICKVCLFQVNTTTFNLTDRYYGISIDPTNTFAYAANYNLHYIYSINLMTGTPTILAGSGTKGYIDGNGSAALFNFPYACAYNPYDSCVYISDFYNAYIRKMTTRLYASTIAGLNASAVVPRIIASNSSLAYAQYALSSNFVTSASVLPSISGIQLWLDGADPLATGKVLSNGTLITSWKDKSGNGYNATALNGGATPTYSSMDGIKNNYLGFSTTLNTNMSNQTVFTVYTTTSVSSAQAIVGGVGSPGSNAYIEVGVKGGSNQINLSYPASDYSSYGTTYTTQLVQTFAGVFGSNSFANGRAWNARFSYPIGIVVDTLGNVFVADYGNNVIRKITPDGTASIYAGTGSPGAVNSSLLGSSFNGPYAMAIDSANNLYVTDINNYLIRKITSTSVTTMAGIAGTYGSENGPKTVATFYTPYGITVDLSGNIYVSDNYLHTIRLITPDGTVSTYAGISGAFGYTDSIATLSKFNYPYGLTCDSSNIYVADRGNYRLRMITPYSSLNLEYSALPLSVVYTPLGFVYFTTANTFTLSSGGIDYPSYCSIFLLTANNTIAPFAKVYQADVPFTTLSPSTCKLWGLAYNPSNYKMYASDNIGNVIYEVSTPTTSYSDHCIPISGYFGRGAAWSDGNGQDASYNKPRGISIDSSTSNIYIADTGNGVIRKLTGYPPYTSTLLYNIDGGQLQGGVRNGVQVYGIFNALNFSNVTSVAFTPYIFSAKILAVAYKSSIYHYVITTSSFNTTPVAGSSTSGYVDGNGTSAQFNSITDIKYDSQINLYIADSGNGKVRFMDVNYNVTTLNSTYFTSPITTVSPFNTTGNQRNYYVGSGGSLYSVGPKVFTIGGQGYAGSNDGGQGVSTFTNIRGLTWFGGINRFMYITDDNLIRRINNAYIITTIAGNGSQDTTGLNDGIPENARFNQPYYIAIFKISDTYSMLYVTDTNSHTIRSLSDVPDIVIGGNVTTDRTLFTSVVQMGQFNGVSGYVNGTLVSKGSIFHPFIQTGTFIIGSTYNAAGFFERAFTGTIQEIIIYNSTLTTTQRQSVEFYLQQKWFQSSWQASYAGKSNTTTQAISFQNLSTIINANLYATTITAPTFTAYMPKGTTSNGFFYGNGLNVTNISDRRLKTDIRPIEHALEKVSSMQAVRYRMYRDPSQMWIGYVAQDLEPILPEVVRTDAEGWKSIQYATLPALIIEAVKELNEKYEKIKYLLSNTV